MSLTKRVTWDEHGDPVLTITVTGHSDVYRLACHLETGQCEFADFGRRVLASLQRRWGAKTLSGLEAYYWGPDGRNGRFRRRVTTPAAVAEVV